jgi:geranylgeranyl diphosphate synthase type II
MVGGEVVDTEMEGKEIGKDVLDFIHTRKTGALIAVSCRTGARLADAPAGLVERLSVYGEKIGLAYQIVDDVLDVEGTPEELGKDVGSDALRDKATYPAVVGLARSKQIAAELVVSAKQQLSAFDGEAAVLCDFADYVLCRRN